MSKAHALSHIHRAALAPGFVGHRDASILRQLAILLVLGR
jgi:hypothetical protein